MVWEIVIGVILVMGILTTVIEICVKRNRKKAGKEKITRSR